VEDMCYERRKVRVFIPAGPSTKLFALLCLLLQYLIQSCARGGGGIWRTCCMFIYYCSTYYKAVREGAGGEVEDMCYKRLRAEAYVN
jgi:hypothetical protein